MSEELRYTAAALPGTETENTNAMLRRLGKPIRAVLRWQLIVTATLVLIAGVAAGVQAALSAVLGGLVTIVAGLLGAMVATISRGESAGGVLFAALTAEGVKIGTMVVLLWLVMATYQNVVAPAFFGTFAATAVVFAMAFAVREP